MESCGTMAGKRCTMADDIGTATFVSTPDCARREVWLTDGDRWHPVPYGLHGPRVPAPLQEAWDAQGSLVGGS